jgi:3D-(3,5/4)-trihydroxycyclohexane-1,2-dione acylhydrolase (decyclizing)
MENWTMMLTVSEAIVKWILAQKIQSNLGVEPYFAGVHSIFGHGNALGIGVSLSSARDSITTYRGQTEEGMALAAVGYAKAKRRQQCQVVTTSIGPGALNVVTAAGVALANRLPLFILAGDTFISRSPDPVLQQVEHFDEPSLTVNDAFKAVTRFWDRITSPSQILTSLPQALNTLLDPATCGPVFLALPQDIQVMKYEFPEEFFLERVHEIPRARADLREIDRAVELINNAKQPLIIAGGGVHYSLAESALSTFAAEKQIPVAETMAGKSCLTWAEPNLIGPIGVTGSASVNEVVEAADLIIAIGTRLQDFTTGSWTLFADKDIVAINVARFDASKRRSHPVVGDARTVLEELHPRINKRINQGKNDWMEIAKSARAKLLEEIEYRRNLSTKLPSYAQVVIAVNEEARPHDYVMTAAGGLPGELNVNWLSHSTHSFDCEYGFSCMGYEISGAWGAAMARSEGRVITLLGDGSYMMLNSDIYSAVLHKNPMTIILCDNGGYGVISRLQTNNGAESFRTMITEDQSAARVDFVSHAKSMGAHALRAHSISDLRAMVARSLTSLQVEVIVIDTEPALWSEGGAFWEVGVADEYKTPEFMKMKERQRGF